MWCRFLVFCVLVSFILFVVASCIYRRPVIHLFFHRCCEEDIENDQVIFENFGNNFLKERLVGGDIVEAGNETLFEIEDIGRIIDDMKEVLSINYPEVKKWVKDGQVGDSVVPNVTIEDNPEQMYDGVTEMDKEENLTTDGNKYEILEEIENVTETDNKREYLNVHSPEHKKIVRLI